MIAALFPYHLPIAAIQRRIFLWWDTTVVHSPKTVLYEKDFHCLTSSVCAVPCAMIRSMISITCLMEFTTWFLKLKMPLLSGKVSTNDHLDLLQRRCIMKKILLNVICHCHARHHNSQNDFHNLPHGVDDLVVELSVLVSSDKITANGYPNILTQMIHAARTEFDFEGSLTWAWCKLSYGCNLNVRSSARERKEISTYGVFFLDSASLTFGLNWSSINADNELTVTWNNKLQLKVANKIQSGYKTNSVGKINWLSLDIDCFHPNTLGLKSHVTRSSWD